MKFTNNTCTTPGGSSPTAGSGNVTTNPGGSLSAGATGSEWIRITAPTQPGFTFNGWTANQGTFTTSGPSGATLCAMGSPNGTNTYTANYTAVATALATSLSVATATGTFGGTTALSATLRRTSDSSAVSGKSVTFTLNGNSAGMATTNASGVAAIASASLGGINAGTYPTGVLGASFAGDSSFATSSGSASLTVSPANQSITFTSTAPSNAVVGGSYQPQATGGASGNAVTFGASGACSWNGSTESVTMTSVGTCTVTADQAGNANYNAATQATQVFTVGKAPGSISISNIPASATFGGSFTPTYTSNLDGAKSTASLTAAVGTVTAGVVDYVGSGICTLQASVAAGTNWTAAPACSTA